MDDIKIEYLTGDGGYSSDECLELLKECDVVVTNPPFSRLRDYVKTLMEYDKKFIIIGNMNAITYKEIFPLIKNNELWLGCSLHGIKCHFLVGDDYDATNAFVDDDGKKKAKVNNAVWFTNVDHKKRHSELDLYKKYSPEDYPKYDNYDAIEVSKVCEIPLDYEGVMGVPITFLDKYCPTQFEIIGFWNCGVAGDNIGATYCEANSAGKVITWNGPTVNKQTKYFRILIRRIS